MGQGGINYKNHFGTGFLKTEKCNM